MDIIDLTEKQLSTQDVYDGRLLHVKEDQVILPNGKEATREYIVHPGAVVVVPLLDNGDVLLVRQFRYPLRREFYELPAGKIDAGEETLACGQRELLEETGFVAGSWHYLTTIHPCIGYSDERILIYLAQGLQQPPTLTLPPEPGREPLPSPPLAGESCTLKGIKRGGNSYACDEDEFVENFYLPLPEALEWVRDGRISDVKTVIGLFWAEKIIGRQWPPGLA